MPYASKIWESFVQQTRHNSPKHPKETIKQCMPAKNSANVTANPHFPQNSNTKVASPTKRLFKTYNTILYVCYTIQQHSICIANNKPNDHNLIKKNRTTVITIRVTVSNSNRQTFGTQPTNIYTAHIHAGCFNSSWQTLRPIPTNNQARTASRQIATNSQPQTLPKATTLHSTFQRKATCARANW